MAATPLTFRYSRAGVPLRHVGGKSSTTTFRYARAGVPYRALVVVTAPAAPTGVTPMILFLA